MQSLREESALSAANRTATAVIASGCATSPSATVRAEVHRSDPQLLVCYNKVGEDMPRLPPYQHCTAKLSLFPHIVISPLSTHAVLCI